MLSARSQQQPPPLPPTAAAAANRRRYVAVESSAYKAIVLTTDTTKTAPELAKLATLATAEQHVHLAHLADHPRGHTAVLRASSDGTHLLSLTASEGACTFTWPSFMAMAFCLQKCLAKVGFDAGLWKHVLQGMSFLAPPHPLPPPSPGSSSGADHSCTQPASNCIFDDLPELAGKENDHLWPFL